MGADQAVLLRLYRTHIRSRLDYGSIVYGSARKSYIEMLDTIHNQGLRICLGAFRTSPVESLCVAANEESLYRRRDRLALQYALRMKSTPTNAVHDTIFKPRYETLFRNKPTQIPNFGLWIQETLRQIPNLDMSIIHTNISSDKAHWELNEPDNLLDLNKTKKSLTQPLEYIAKFNEQQINIRNPN